MYAGLNTLGIFSICGRPTELSNIHILCYCASSYLCRWTYSCLFMPFCIESFHTGQLLPSYILMSTHFHLQCSYYYIFIWLPLSSIARIFVWGGHPADATQPCTSRSRLNLSCRGQLGTCERSSSQQSHGWSPRAKYKL